MNLEDFLDKELDTGDVGSIDGKDRNPSKEEKNDSKDSKKEGGIFSRGSRKKKFQAWFKNN